MHRNLATVGRFDGKSPSLALAITGGKVLLHCPHSRRDDNQETRSLNINRQATSIKAGQLSPPTMGNRNCLMPGTPASVMVYNVEENADDFFKEVQDGVNALTVGNLSGSGMEKTLCVVGGNCSLQAFDHEGQELFWTVAGDNVSVLTLVDVDEDRSPQLVVGTEDFEIRALKGRDVSKKMTETDMMVGFETSSKRPKFAYALMNGTVDVYDKMSRAWRVKSKVKANCLGALDLDADRAPELIAGWENGKVEVRHEKTGEVLNKDYFQAPVAALKVAFYRLDGKDALMALTTDGDVRGWLCTSTEGDASGWNHVPEVKNENQAYRELLARSSSKISGICRSR